MKISHLIYALLTLALGGAGIYYSLEQKHTMNLLVAMHGGGALVDDSSATGLRKFSKELISEDISGERSKALDEAAKALNQMKADRTQRNDSRTLLEQAQSTLSGKEADLEEAKRKVAEMEARITATLEKLKAQLPGDWEDESELSSTMEKLKNLVQEQTEINSQRKTEFAEKQDTRKNTIDKVASQTVDLNKIALVNEEFFDNYCKNDDEFVVVGVDPRWRFVVFNVPVNSRIVAGDATPLIIKRDGVMLARLRVVSITNGQVVAEYDPELLPPGVALQVGDRVFRQKPLGS